MDQLPVNVGLAGWSFFGLSVLFLLLLLFFVLLSVAVLHNKSQLLPYWLEIQDVKWEVLLEVVLPAGWRCFLISAS